MKLREKFKRFWTMDVHNHEGFTLVELIIVIAILAILSGVAVAGYSSYIKKANMQADKTMVKEIENALMLAYYAEDLSENVSITLSTAGVVNEVAENSALDLVMDAAFGSNWRTTLKLKYADWKGMTSDQMFAEAYLNSSFNGNEDALIGQLGNVTNLLKDALGANAGLVGSSFEAYLKELGVDTTDNQAVSNAAVLYAANTINGLDENGTDAVNDAFAAFYTPGTTAYGNMATLMLSLKDELGTFGAAAALYAHGEAFGQYVSSNGNPELLEEFHEFDMSEANDADAALNKVAENLGTMIEKAKNDQDINGFAMQYIGTEQYAADVNAYLEAMKKINANADKFTDNLDDAGCYTDGTAAALLQAAVMAGSMNLGCENGQVVIWIAGGVTGNSVFGIQD